MAGNAGDHIYCPHCGKALPANARFCAGCGQAIVLPAAEQAPGRSHSRWLLLAAIVAAMAIGAVVAWTLLRSDPYQQIVIGSLDRDGSYDIHIIGPDDELSRDNRALREVRLSHHFSIREAVSPTSPDPSIAALLRSSDD